ncbi:MAG: DUF3320 domain-containing protein [Magnetococcales bacterium]|nr:DUF3320 domain-containing protein [Magnetococcales bacterium]
MSNDEPIIGCGGIRLQASLTPKINLSFHQNAIPALLEVVIVNEGELPVANLELTLSSEPAFLKSKSWRIEAVGAGQRRHLPDLDVVLDAALLGRLTEAETAQATFILSTAQNELTRHEVSIELLPRNHWGGIGHMPELAAAFVQPNDPAVDRLLKKTAEILRQHGKNSALNGYSDGPKQAWELTSALWSAVASLGLDYALPPASFENSGQKVRGPSQVVDTGLATCLDSTLLFCAALEQCGLHPLILFTQGHALAGAWLKDEAFSSPVVDDVTALRKRIQLNELVLFETTLATHRPCPPFSVAARCGEEKILPDRESEFRLAVDVRRTRMQRIRPLASAASPHQDPPSETAEILPPPFEEAPELPDERILPQQPEEPKGPEDRLHRWQRRLLDLSLRNNLLNFRSARKAITLEAPDPGQLEDRLADGHALRLRPRPDLMQGADPRSRTLHEARTGENVLQAHALDALARKELFVNLPSAELETRLVDLYRSSRLNLQEGGANTLFVAMGFLSWHREAKEARNYLAPLILIPVTLTRQSVQSGFTLSLHDDESRFNPTLLQMLRQDFKLTLPVNDGELPKDDHGLDVAGIWKAVARTIKEIKGWEVVEEVALATFSFAKYLMWKDLVERTGQLKQNPVVRHLLDTPRDPYSNRVAFSDPRDLDALHGPEQTFCPLPSDSSQLSAVMAAARGKDFVMVGPPGTGKSQTIANLIGQCLTEGKTVLFVSEKMAALNVVYRRLREVGLSDFCLELHSSKANKLEVLEQFRTAWEARGESDETAWHREAQRLKSLRDQLNRFVSRLHHRHRNGLTAYAALGRVVAGRDRIAPELSWPSPDAHDEEALDALRELADRLEVNARRVEDFIDHPLGWIVASDWSPGWQQTLLRSAAEMVPLVDEVKQRAHAFHQATGLPETMLSTRMREGLSLLARVTPLAHGRDWRFVLRPDASRLVEAMRGGCDLVKEHRRIRAELSRPYSLEVTQGLQQGLNWLARHRELGGALSMVYRPEAALEAHQLKKDLEIAQSSPWPLSWMRRRRVAKALTAAAAPSNKAAQGKPDMARDLNRMVEMRELESSLATLSPLLVSVESPWRGMETHPDEVNSALALQRALASQLDGERWRDEGLAAVENGRCGPAMAADLQRLKKLRALEGELAALDQQTNLTSASHGLWRGLRTSLEEVADALAFQQRLERALVTAAPTPERLVEVKSALSTVLGDGNALLAPSGSISVAGREMDESFQRFHEASSSLARLAGLSPESLMAVAGDLPEGVARMARGVGSLSHKLNYWCAWRAIRGEAMLNGLAPLVQGLERGTLSPDAVRETFDLAHARWWLNAVVDNDEVLKRFVPDEHEKRIADFKLLDERFTNLTRDYARARLCANLPGQNDVLHNSEWGVLRNELQKKKRHLPLRELFNRIPTSLPKLTPCLLMSPLSIAQHLAAGTAAFDLVVFDEASQIPVWDAIGAMARGKQVVMVGDPKQLPPTSFFDRAESDADAEDVEGDMESILDECLGAGIPQLPLRWHYRSRHESLIAFSNHHYYDGKLITFPSPFTEDPAVRFHLVSDGVYEKGGSRTNPMEARALTADLVSRLQDPAFVRAPLTIGVVTFNSEQQRLIEDLLDEERRKNPALEPYFAEGALEGVFVKNLESVQGDERDIIYFSITYGPDRGGAISMNFGPLNRDGGERRLNVAITRARHEMRVFSSLQPEQLDLSRTQARGVRDLKHFLEFAQRGAKAMGEAVRGSVGDHESPFERTVALALNDKGWVVHPQVGVSSFRIDLGVVDPDAPGRYLAGVECDGATYHRSATARDRDKLREQVLRGLGWDLLRIWSTDWWLNPQDALDKTHSGLERLLQARRERRAEEARGREEEQMRRAEEEERTQVENNTPGGQESAAAPDGGVPDERPSHAAPPRDAPTRRDTPPVHDSAATYRRANPASVATLRPDAFFEPNYDDALKSMIHHVVEIEGPIHESALGQRISQAHGWGRCGPRIRERVLSMAQAQCAISRETVGTFYWPPEADPTHCPSFRRPMGEETRPVDETALPEWMALARELRDQGLEMEAALPRMAREAGLMKLRASTRERLELAWRTIVESA